MAALASLKGVQGHDPTLMPLAEDFARTVNHDLGYDQYLKQEQRTKLTNDALRVTKFDVLNLLTEHPETKPLLTFIATNVRSNEEAAKVR